jgi:hypothetical protein
MIESKLALLAEGISIDQESNQVSILNMLENLAGESFPLFIQRVVFFALFGREDADPSQHQAVFSITVGDRELVRQALQIDFADKKRTRAVVRMGAIVIPQPGSVVFKFVVGTVEARYVLDVASTASSTVATTPRQPH